jgi:hypothetical protein
MMGILSQSFMIATRMEPRVWVPDAKQHEGPRSKARYFWQGRKWRQGDTNTL